MSCLKFPHIPIKLCVPLLSSISKHTNTTGSNKKRSKHYSIPLDLKTIYLYILSQPEFSKYELGGEYYFDSNHSVGGKFYIDPSVSFYDIKEDSPYTELNRFASSRIVWHSHPFRDSDPNNFPSIEDMDAVRLTPSNIHLLLVDHGVYVLSSVNEYTSIDSVLKLYLSMQNNKNCNNDDMWNYKEIQSNFFLNKLSTLSYMKKYGFYVCFIHHSKLFKDPKILDDKIIDAFLHKSLDLRDQESTKFFTQHKRHKK